MVKTIKKFTNKNNLDLYFVYLPDYIRYAKKYDNNHSHLKNIEKIIIDNKIDFINIDELVFKKLIILLIFFHLK